MSDEDPAKTIYLDYNATTPVAPEVIEAMLPYFKEHFGNPSSDHVVGRRARLAIEESREQVASLIGANADEIVFTSGGTESNNLAILGHSLLAEPDRRRIMTSQVEHPATLVPCSHLENNGWLITRVPVLSTGEVDLDALNRTIASDVSLVTVLLAQNETGALMPISAITEAAKAVGASVHSDSAQAVAKIPISVDDLGVNFLSIAGHKLYGPKGIGALYIRRGSSLRPVIVGADQEHGYRPGTENVPGIVGLGEACRQAKSRLAADGERISALRNELWSVLTNAIKGLVRHTPFDSSLPNTLFISFPHVRGIDLLSLTPNVAASTGSACHAGVSTPSATLLAIGVSSEVALGAVRFSLGRYTSLSDVTTAAASVIAAFEKLTAQ